MNKCPRCKNEKTREDYNYCPICGVNLNEEMKKAGVDVLKFLMNSYIEKECNDSEEEEFKKIIVGALEVAILELERTAQEVPVQEQSMNGIRKLAKKISTYLPTHDIPSK
jgi:hypothetical protein